MRKKKDTVVERMLKMRRVGAEARKGLVAQTELNQAFIEGEQWLENSLSGGFRSVDSFENEEGVEGDRPVFNKMRSDFRRKLFLYFKEKPVITCFSGGVELSDNEVALVASKLLEHVEVNNAWGDVRREAVSWAMTSGMSFIVPVWDSQKGPASKRKVKNFVEDGVKTPDGKVSFVEEKEEYVAEGDVAFMHYPVIQVYTFPLKAKSWKKVESCVVVDLVSEDWIYENIGGDVDISEFKVFVGDEQELGVARHQTQVIGGEWYAENEGVESDKHYMMLQLFEKPSSEFPEGRYVTVVGEKLVEDGSLPYLKYSRQVDPNDNYNIQLGIFPVYTEEVPGRLIPKAQLTHWRDPQIEINELLWDVKLNRRTNLRNKLLHEEGSIDADAWTDEATELVALQPGTSIVPQYVMGKPIPGIEAEWQRAIQNFEEASGIPPVLRGLNETQVRGSQHFDFIRDEAMVRVYDEVGILERSYELQSRFVLAMVKDRYSLKRIVDIYGRQHEGDVMTFDDAKNLNYDIRVKTGSMKPMNHFLVEMKINELLQGGVFRPVQEGGIGIRAYREMMRNSSLNFGYSPEEGSRYEAKRESKLMLRGRVLIPVEEEDHQIHIEEHLDFMKTSAFKAKLETAKDGSQLLSLHRAHIKYHRDIWSRMQAPMSSSPMSMEGMMSGLPDAQGVGQVGRMNA